MSSLVWSVVLPSDGLWPVVCGLGSWGAGAVLAGLVYCGVGGTEVHVIERREFCDSMGIVGAFCQFRLST